jgi:isopentenyldiphosphate isomerase
MDSNDEWLDLVDCNDHVIGKMRRSEVYQKKLSNFRVINAFIINADEKLWIPRRSPLKKLFPSCLDMSAAGHVESGESYDEAFKRETFEETAIDVSAYDYSLIGHATPDSNGVSAFMNLYLIRCNEVPQYNQNDFTEFFWLTPDEVIEWIRSGEPHKSDLPKLLQLLKSSL